MLPRTLKGRAPERSEGIPPDTTSYSTLILKGGAGSVPIFWTVTEKGMTIWSPLSTGRPLLVTHAFKSGKAWAGVAQNTAKATARDRTTALNDLLYIISAP